MSISTFKPQNKDILYKRLLPNCFLGESRMECPFGCGWEGEEFSEHFNVCPAKVCPHCGSTNVFFIRVDKIECVQCKHTWPKPPQAPPEKEHIIKTFKTEDEFRAWLSEQKLTAEPLPGTGILKGEDRVASYFETKEGIEVDLVNSNTWRYTNDVFMKVETEEGVALEEIIETPVEVKREES